MRLYLQPNETHPKVQPRAGRENQEGVAGSLTNEIQRRRGDLPPATDSLPGVVPVKGLSPAKTQLSAADSYESALENVVRENAVPSLAGISTLGYFRMRGKGLRIKKTKKKKEQSSAGTVGGKHPADRLSTAQERINAVRHIERASSKIREAADAEREKG
ncbi:hypothetical protein E4U58_004360 [Claviceps cyperi]|nr:hypothetical protein E4U58_004360 [Claviceps cyperi]